MFDVIEPEPARHRQTTPNGHPTNHNLDALDVVHGKEERERERERDPVDDKDVQRDTTSMSIASTMTGDRHIIRDAIKSVLRGRASDGERTDVLQQFLSMMTTITDSMFKRKR